MRWARLFAAGAATRGLPAGPQPPGRPSTGRPRGHGPTRRRAERNEACGRRRSAVRAAYRVHRRGELDLDRHCTSWLRAALSAQGWTIWPVVRARRALKPVLRIAPKTTL